MKNYAFLCIFACLFFTQIAQAQKVGYTNPELVLSALPETKKLQDDLEKYEKQLMDMLEGKQKELEMKYDEIVKGQKTMPQIILEQKMQDFQRLQSSLEEFQYKAEQDLARYQSELLNPVFKKISDTIGQIAKDEKFDFIFNTHLSQNPVLFYAEKKEDITNKVIVKLGGKPLEIKND